MDAKLVLVKSITLLYRESLIQDKTDTSVDMVRQAIEKVKIPEAMAGIIGGNSIITSLKEVVLDMCRNPSTYIYVKEDLLQTIKIACDGDDNTYNIIKDAIDMEMSEGALKRSIVNIRKGFIKLHKDEAVSDILNKAAWDMKFNRDKIKDTSSWLSEIITRLEPYQVVNTKKDPAIEEAVSFEDNESITTVFNTVESENNGKGVIQFGWQALNNMLGGGIRPGEYVMLMALQHNWKSGLSLSMFKQIPLYNKPYLMNKAKKPLIIRISFEDPLKYNFQFLYKSFKENETGEVYTDIFKDKIINPETGEKEKIPVITAREKSEYVINKLKVNGWYIEMMKVTPSDWTYKDICNLIIEREADGYEVKVCMVDYLQKIPTIGCDQGPMGHDLRNLNERVKAFMAARNCIFITPWQLSPEAKMLKREGHLNFVTKLVGGGYTSGSKQLDQVIDIGILFTLEYVNKEWYLDLALDKLRRVDQPEEGHRRFALKFNNTSAGRGVILEDIGKENSAYKRRGGERIGASEKDSEFWDF